MMTFVAVNLKTVRIAGWFAFIGGLVVALLLLTIVVLQLVALIKRKLRISYGIVLRTFTLLLSSAILIALAVSFGLNVITAEYSDNEYTSFEINSYTETVTQWGKKRLEQRYKVVTDDGREFIFKGNVPVGETCKLTVHDTTAELFGTNLGIADLVLSSAIKEELGEGNHMTVREGYKKEEMQ